MERREFLKRSGIVIAASSTKRPAFASLTRKRWNVLFITADDMNWSIPGFMGNPLGLTPRLDALAEQSHRFTRNRTTAPICQPSREAMMTGRIPHHSGALGFDPIYAGTPTLVTVLKSEGFYTAAVHKTEHMQPDSCFPWDSAVKGRNRRPDEYGDAVAAAISAAQHAKRPFFISCNINDPHRPFYGSPQANEMDHNDEDGYAIPKEIRPEEVEVPPILEDLPEIRQELAQYYNSAQRMDISIGKVLNALKASGEEKDTVVLFSADHGMPFPFAKATTYDYGTRTPALLRYPGMGISKTFEDRTCNIDYMPTLLNLLHVRVPSGVDGISWYPLLRGRKIDVGEFMVTHVNDVATGAQYPMRTVQDDRYSLVFTPWSDGKLKLHIESMSGLTFKAMKKAAETDPAIASRVAQYTLGTPLALYDLTSDPGERVNIIGDSAHAERVARMKSYLLTYMKRTDDPQLNNFELLLAGKQPVVTQPATLRFKPVA